MSELNLSQLIDKLKPYSHFEASELQSGENMRDDIKVLIGQFIRRVLDIVGKLPESADTVRAFHTIKELAGEKLIVPQDFDVSLDKTLPNTAGSEGDDVVKFKMTPWDKHGNKPKAEDK